ncbi:MAG: class II aldolase/adducin family protein [Actinobacteria bacterium]|nr:class II aldolase/adducin family protein [Actinomycetota bacterium]MBU1493477.1 class II aldolase/adducin family protein [Actinomycetota bacterium]MBU1865002.1 class II aldolase/adducin family protein [Actinomycetota bacterium]
MVLAARDLFDRGLNTGTAGNVSVRFGDWFLITPSGIRYDALEPTQIVEMDMEGASEGRMRPSSEWRFHLDIYKARPEVGAIVHTHPPFGTAVAALRREVPAFHYMVAVAGGTTIRCAPYATFGTQLLSDYVQRALEDRTACLLANHGMVAVEATLEQATQLAIEVEMLCRMYLTALAAGEPHVLTDEEMQEVLDKFADYRNPPAHKPWD